MSKIKPRSFKNSEHINEKRDGPYHGFKLLKLISDPLHEANENYSKFVIFKMVVNTKSSIIQMGPNILSVGLRDKDLQKL